MNTTGTIVALAWLSPDTVVFRFHLRNPIRVPTGSHVVATDRVDAPQTGDRVRLVRRPYTPITHPSEAVQSGHHRLDVYIRLYSDGEMSQLVGSRWRLGHTVGWSGPIAGFYTPLAGYGRVVMFAAGSGITPLLQLVRHHLLLSGDDEELLVKLVWSVRQLQLVFPREQLLTELAAFWNFSYQLYVSGDDRLRLPSLTTPPLYGEPVVCRRLNCDDIGALVANEAQRTRYLICGPREYIEFVVSALSSAGCRRDDMFVF